MNFVKNESLKRCEFYENYYFENKYDFLDNFGFLQSYPGGGAKWIPAWELHSRDPTLVMWKAVYSMLEGGLDRKNKMAQLHVYPEGIETVPEEIYKSNFLNLIVLTLYFTCFVYSGISGQVEPVRPVPKRLEEFSKEELEKFPKFWDFPEEYVIK